MIEQDQMGKVLWVEDEQFDQSHRSYHGCMYGVFHALDYHHWRSNVKKILPHRKHEALKRNRSYQRISDDQDSFEVLRLLDAKTSHIQMDERNRKANSTHKRSLKARIKAIVSEDNHKDRNQDFEPSPKLHRTYSIHHLEPSDWVHPIVFFPKKNTKNPEMNNSQDILDMFEVDKDLFINTLQDGAQDSVTKPKLIKSGSFPTAYKSENRILMPMKLKDKLNEIYTIPKSGRINNSNDDLNGNNIIRLRRISSLNESADRYAHFFDFSVGKEAALRSSRSLKLTNGSENVLSVQQPRSFRSFSQNERNLVSLSVEKDEYSESLTEVMDRNDNFLENEGPSAMNSHESGKDPHGHGFKIKEHNQQVSQEITQESPPVLVHEYGPPDENIQNSEGLDMLTDSHGSLKKEVKIVKDDDFTYVKKILERSGFLRNGFHQPWYSSNQPLDPLVFQELESQYFHDPDRFAEEVKELLHRLLIFDLVDEVLLTVYGRSSTYYLKTLSFSHIRLAPNGSHVLDQVWNRVSRWIDLKHDMNESLNDIVARDLTSDGWMNLQVDFECVGVNLEDWILDDVLEELLFEFI